MSRVRYGIGNASFILNKQLGSDRGNPQCMGFLALAGSSLASRRDLSIFTVPAVVLSQT